ncbi:uncharacterized protein ASCRUDRAFT_5941 [Ascoidea rubescens DSM 1968]|uniref:Uncharacterized protein n=1 Tax=Ascoidea rubescens DSM 1968 TaxID=1344418 RepID=A0A1D2VR27_9ASCO|nr:hypothetical protein ASCRUDRAFT_5941 [Ascoidea rubescens DSM 1968]ODV64061.1 hypothetical protein ASCRUDRAFT_5941 [Ascoidea rubescens DSM 1968]
MLLGKPQLLNYLKIDFYTTNGSKLNSKSAATQSCNKGTVAQIVHNSNISCDVVNSLSPTNEQNFRSTIDHQMLFNQNSHQPITPINHRRPSASEILSQTKNNAMLNDPFAAQIYLQLFRLLDEKSFRTTSLANFLVFLENTKLLIDSLLHHKQSDIDMKSMMIFSPIINITDSPGKHQSSKKPSNRSILHFKFYKEVFNRNNLQNKTIIFSNKYHQDEPINIFVIRTSVGEPSLKMWPFCPFPFVPIMID